MKYDRASLENQFSKLQKMLTSFPELLNPPTPETVDADSMIDQLELLAKTGATNAPDLYDYFRIIANFGLHSVTNLFEYTNPCDLHSSIKEREFRCTIVKEAGGSVTDDLDSAKKCELPAWPLSLVPISESEGQGYAIACGRINPGSIWSVNKTGTLDFEFDSINSFADSLVGSFEGSGSFADSTPIVDSQGIIEWL